VAQRARSLTVAAIDRAFDDRRILRTHVLRPTWHFVVPGDLRWMQALSAPRLRRLLATYERRLEIDARLITRVRRIVETALAGGRSLTREALAAELRRRGRIDASGQRLAHLVMYLEVDAVICSGPRQGRQFSYALVDDRVPPAPDRSRDEALGELARRYFQSHGPATVHDFAWWSGLTMGEARRGAGAVDSELVLDPKRTRNFGVFTSAEFPHQVVLDGRRPLRDGPRRAVRPRRLAAQSSSNSNATTTRVPASLSPRTRLGTGRNPLPSLLHHRLVVQATPSIVARIGVRPQARVTGGTRRVGTFTYVQPPFPGMRVRVARNGSRRISVDDGTWTTPDVENRGAGPCARVVNCRLLAGPSPANELTVEQRCEVALTQGVEKPQRRSEALEIERRSTFRQHAAHVVEVLLAAGQQLGDDQVLRADERNDRTAHVHRNDALDEQLFETRPGQHDVEGEPGGRMFRAVRRAWPG
jgi:hypothetical protein